MAPEADSGNREQEASDPAENPGRQDREGKR
jgi:hypothetical protein